MPLRHAENPQGRTERSSRASAAKGADATRLPSAPRERRPLLAALAVLLIVGGALLAGLLATQMDHRVEMLAAADTVKAGQVITKDDLASVRVSADVSGLIPVTSIDQVVGRTARVEISKGQLVDTSQIATENLPGSDQQVVGVSLEAGRFPASGLTAGDVVDIVSVVNGSGSSGASAANPGPGSGGGSGSSSGSGTAPLERSDSGSGADSGTASGSVTNAQVLDAVPSSGKDGDWTSGATVSVIVPTSQAAGTAALGASNNAAVVVTATGQPIGEH